MKKIISNEKLNAEVPTKPIGYAIKINVITFLTALIIMFITSSFLIGLFYISGQNNVKAPEIMFKVLGILVIVLFFVIYLLISTSDSQFIFLYRIYPDMKEYRLKRDEFEKLKTEYKKQRKYLALHKIYKDYIK